MQKTEPKSLINKVANSKLITLNLGDYSPKTPIVHFDLKSFLFKELMLKEKDFRQDLADWDWSKYKEKIVLIYCSNDAIIPQWAFMLVAKYLNDNCQEVYFGNEKEFLESYFKKTIDNIDLKSFQNKPIVVKGCGDSTIPTGAYVYITHKLINVATSIMYGEPCSTVPIYKRPK